ncbi:pyridoxal-dependent decarboxylase [Pelagophyceae sp. CCMP2097]|nr:pyridoxal-dependent decarboxylase [Pelagophyceae sp. CCMP2097]
MPSDPATPARARSASACEEREVNLEDDRSLYVVSADLENDGYVAGATEMGAGIVISHVLAEDIHTSEYFDPEELVDVEDHSKRIDDQVVDVSVGDIFIDEVPFVDKDLIDSTLEKMYDLYANEDLMEGMLEMSRMPTEEPLSLAELTVIDDEKADSAAADEVYAKYGCRQIQAGGPLAITELATAYIAHEDVDDSFYIMDLGNVQRLYDAWHHAMPRVTPFYAVKCSPMPAVVDVLAANGCGFDCASAVEIDLVLNAGVSPDRIIFAHPAKRPHDIRFAAAKDVKLTTFDSVCELDKIAKWHPHAGCVLRIRADDPHAGISFGIKYGANEDEYEPLMEHARALGLAVVGVSFHVGSLARSGGAFYEAIRAARSAFDIAASLGFAFTLLDIGGGFTGRFNSNGIVQSMVSDIPANINEALDTFFGEKTPYFETLKVIAEPGRYFAEASMHLACHVHSVRNRVEKRTTSAAAGGPVGPVGPAEVAAAEVRAEDVCDYLISDGLYGSFNCVVYDGAKPRAWLVPGPTLPPMESTALIRSTVFGPTCDSMDCVFKDVMLPQLRVGDWLLFPHFGAYTLAGATNFNGIQAAAPAILYVNSRSSVDDENCVIMWACEMEKPPSAIVAPSDSH